MINIWIVTTFLSLFMLVMLIFYHLYYRMNIKHITKQLKEIMNIKDTNELLTVVVKQRDIAELVNQLNNLIGDIRMSRIKIKRLNRNFRQSITNISHDLRTPLTTASGYVQMLQTCGVRSRNTSQGFVIIIEFTHFASFYNFNTNGDDFRNKEVIQGVKVRVGI